MKRLLLLFLIFLLFSCKSGHYNDGRYKAEIIDPNTFLSHTEILTIDGNVIYDDKYTLTGELAEKLKVPCVQYPERIEFTQASGVTKIMTVENDGSLKLSEDIIFSKLAPGDSGIPERIKEKPLIKIEGDKIIMYPTQR